MASQQGDIISNSVESSLDIKTTSMKTKSSIPLRMMEEEVWFSGSELKTDNSSSEDDQIEHNPTNETQNRLKGARRKTKFVCNSRRNETQILREHRHHLNKTISEKVKTVKEVTSASASGKYEMIIVSTSEVEWRPKRGSISLPGLTSELERLSVSKLHSQNDATISSLNKLLIKYEDTTKEADDEKTQLQKIKCLEERIAEAEKVYMNARQETDRLVLHMETILHDVSKFPGTNWKFFNNITRKWIDCLSRHGSKTEIACQERSHSLENENRSIEQNQLKKSRHLANKNKYRNRKLIKIRKGTNYNIVLKNIKQCTRTRFTQDFKPPDLSEFEKTRLNELLNNTTNNLYDTGEEFLGYRLLPGEMARIDEISNQLKTSRIMNLTNPVSRTSINDRLSEDNDNGDDNQIQNIEYCPTEGDYYQFNSLTDSEKRKLYSSQSNLSLADSFDEYGSCYEVTSDIASSTNLVDRSSD